MNVYNKDMTTYILAGGCFWCLDAVYRRIRGVTSVTSGYTGGHTKNPTYYDVASGATGYAESVQVTFDETIISPNTILELYFLSHNPTTLNQDGANFGTQYRSAMFYADDNQKQLFQKAIDAAKSNWRDPIVTSLEELTEFYPAEEEHQDYFNKNPAAGYCTIIINPKLSKARAKFSHYFMEESL
jgi:peptide-methionine (S)-S-oxide reductase